MELRDLKVGEFYWWAFCPGNELLVRLRYLGRDFLSVQIVAGTAKQVLQAGYGVGDTVNTLNTCLRKPTEAERDA